MADEPRPPARRSPAPATGQRLRTRSRLDPARNLEAIQVSLARFGQQKPIVVGEDGVVVAGNGTLQAARCLDDAHLHLPW